MGVKFYFDLLSQPSRAVFMFLRSNKDIIPFTEVPVALRKGEHLMTEYSAINPLQTVPAIDHDGFRLPESVSIMRYLCREFPVANHWYPKESKNQAVVDAYMAWQHLNLRNFGVLIFRNRILNPLATSQPPNEDEAKKYAQLLEDVLKVFEEVWLKDRPFVAGDELTVADLFAAAEMEQPGAAGFDVYKGHPKIKTYMESVRSRLQPHYDEAHVVLNRAKEKYKGKFAPLN